MKLDLRLGSPTRVLLLGLFARNRCPVFEPVGDTWFASSHVRAQARRRGETRSGQTRGGREDHPLVDASVRCMQLQKLFGRASGSRCRPALSVGRRRDLAFGSLTPLSNRIQKVGGKKVVRRARGRKRAGLQIASAPRKGIQARLQRLIVGGGSCWHLRCGTKLKSFGSRKGTKRWKASRFASSQLSFTGQRWKQTRPHDPIHTSSDEGPNHKPMWRADRRRVGDRDVRGWFASSHRG